MPRAKTTDVVFQARRFQIENVQQIDDDGTIHERHVVRHPGACVILPLVDDDHICLIKNYRVAVDRELYELPAGTLEPPEAPEVTAARELIEETGFRCGQLRLVQQFWMSPGILDEKMYAYVATELTDGESELEAGETIVREIVPITRVEEMLRHGQIQDAKSLALLSHYLHFLRND